VIQDNVNENRRETAVYYLNKNIFESGDIISFNQRLSNFVFTIFRIMLRHIYSQADLCRRMISSEIERVTFRFVFRFMFLPRLRVRE